MVWDYRTYMVCLFEIMSSTRMHGVAKAATIQSSFSFKDQREQIFSPETTICVRRPLVLPSEHNGLYEPKYQCFTCLETDGEETKEEETNNPRICIVVSDEKNWSLWPLNENEL